MFHYGNEDPQKGRKGPEADFSTDEVDVVDSDSGGYGTKLVDEG